MENGTISQDYVFKKAKRQYKKYLRPGENVLEDFPQFMLHDNFRVTIVSKYDDNYLRNYRILHNFKKSKTDTDTEGHQDYVNFCNKHILSIDRDADNELYEDDELGSFYPGVCLGIE